MRGLPAPAFAAFVMAAVTAVVGLALVVFGTAMAHADLFVMCPDGHEGVVGNHTSCGFAENVRNGYFRFGNHFDAFSPAVGNWYQVDCGGVAPAHFVDGVTVNATTCYASSNAEVVVW